MQKAELMTETCSNKLKDLLTEANGMCIPLELCLLSDISEVS